MGARGALAMTFVAFARWAMPRNAHLSSFNRRLAVNIKLNRGLAGCPALHLAAEARPLSGFVEQRVGASAGAGRVDIGETIDDLSDAAAAQAVASILSEIAELNAAVNSTLPKIVGHSSFGIRSNSGAMMRNNLLLL